VVVTSRGCPLHCSYCSLGNRQLYPYRQRSVSSVLSEIEDAVENYGARFIDFEDENLSFNKKWFLSLLNEISSRFTHLGLELRAMNGLYPPTLDDEVVAAMKAAGFKTLNLSLGATCPRQLKRFRRSDVRDAFEDGLALAEKHALNAVGYIIISAPGQNASQSLEDLLYLAQQRVLIGLSVFYPAPGSEDYETSKRIGILPMDTSLFRSSAIPLSHSTSRLQSVTLMRFSRIINFMKHLIDNERELRPPVRIVEEKISSSIDRQSVGEYLLSSFFADAGIRGVSSDDRIYLHTIDKALSEKFLARLKTITVKGACRNLS